MNRTNIIYNETVFEPVCGLVIEPVETDTDALARRRCKRDGACQLTSMAESGRDESREPGKRNGCIGKWMNRPAKTVGEASDQAPPRCQCRDK
jgi:hypothetical protein